MRPAVIVAAALNLALAVPSLAEPPVRGFARVDGGTLFYEVQGTGAAVILIHGGMLDHRAWDPQIAPLVRGHRVVRYDVAGHGRSPVPDGRWRTYEHLRSILAHLGIERAALVGHSMGARIAIDLTIAHPGLVDSLVLLGPGMSGFPFSGRDFLASTQVMSAARAASDAPRAAYRRALEVDPAFPSAMRGLDGLD